MWEIFVLCLLFFLLRFWLLFWCLFVLLALLRLDNLSSAFDLFLPFFTETQLASLFISRIFGFVESIRSETFTVADQTFTKINELVVRISVDIFFPFFFNLLLTCFVSSLTLLILIFPFLLSLLILLFFFLSPLLSLFLLLLFELVLLFSLLLPSYLVFHPFDVLQQILLIIIIVIFSYKVVHVVINPIFKLVFSFLKSFEFKIVFCFDIFPSLLNFALSLRSLPLLFERIKLATNAICLSYFDMELMLNRLHLSIEQIDLILQS